MSTYMLMVVILWSPLKRGPIILQMPNLATQFQNLAYNTLPISLNGCTLYCDFLLNVQCYLAELSHIQMTGLEIKSLSRELNIASSKAT